MQYSSLESVHVSEWRNVKRKAVVKKVAAFLAECGQEPIITISNAFGSVYFDLDDGEQVITIRVSDHERTSSSHAQPDVNIFGSFGDEQRKHIRCLLSGDDYQAPLTAHQRMCRLEIEMQRERCI